VLLAQAGRYDSFSEATSVVSMAAASVEASRFAVHEHTCSMMSEALANALFIGMECARSVRKVQIRTTIFMNSVYSARKKYMS
jgi:hypothetical protein